MSGLDSNDPATIAERARDALQVLSYLADSAPTIHQRCVAALELLTLADDTFGTARTAARKILAEVGGASCTR